jgi:DNA-binding ferritin-like protein
MSDLIIIKHLLAGLRSSYISHQTSHWQVKGPMFYGDHTMMERIYKSVVDEIDTLAEKIVAKFGPEAVDCCEQIDMIADNVHWSDDKCNGDPVLRALVVEESLQKMFEKSYNDLKGMRELSLGMDDFIMSASNNHESNVYLLRQRLQNR